MAPADGGIVTRSDGGIGLRTRLTLHLGVLVQPYRNNGLTTADVAEFLESKYGLMEAFYRVHGDIVMGAMAKSLEGSMESLLMGKRVNPWGYATQVIQREFREFISSREAERVGIPGTPTKAALRGVNHRLKHPYASRNARRPSFIDTGLYQASMRAWVG
jgi:hypothetical protein